MTILYAPPPAYVDHSPTWEVAPSPAAQGAEGRLVEKNISDALRHLNERTECLLANGEPEADGDFTYRHVPFEHVGAVWVKYETPRTLPPRRFPVEDFEE